MFDYDPSAFADIDLDDMNDDYPLLPVGDHDAIIGSAEGRESKVGNKMIEAILEIEHEGRTYKVWDYFVFSPAAKKVLASKCQSLGYLEELKAGKLTPEMLLGTLVRVRIRHQTSEQYGTSAKVAYYHTPTTPKKAAPAAEIDPSDIPF